VRRGVKVLLWVVPCPLALVLVWLAFNGPWADIAPQPVPAELRPQSVTLAPEHNAFFDIQGLLAPAGEMPNAWGQRSWRGEAQQTVPLLAPPSGKDWHCNPLQHDCVSRWRAAAPALRAQQAAVPLLGERCRALASRSALQEPMPSRRPGEAAAALPHLQPFTTCLRWLHIDAVLAADAPQASAAWTQADGLLRLYAAGVQALISQVVGWSVAERHQLLLAQWAASAPPQERPQPAWLAPLPERLLQPRFWMAAEAHYRQDMLRNLSFAALETGASAPAVEASASRYRLGYLPNRSVQMMQAQVLADMQAYGHLQGAALARQVRQMPGRELPNWVAMIWRNPLGNILNEVARPGDEGYPLRQADLGLYQAALVLSQQLNAVPAEERAGWWQRQPLEAGIRERLQLDGNALLLRSWRGEAEAAPPVRFPLRPV